MLCYLDVGKAWALSAAAAAAAAAVLTYVLTEHEPSKPSGVALQK
jgi:hypothetical protein